MRWASWSIWILLAMAVGCQREPDISIEIVFGAGLLERVEAPTEIGFLENPLGGEGQYIDVDAEDWGAYKYVSLDNISFVGNRSTGRVTLVRPGETAESTYWVVARSQTPTGPKVVARGVERLLFSSQQASRDTVLLKPYCSHVSTVAGDTCALLGEDRGLCIPESLNGALGCVQSKCGDRYVDSETEQCDSGLDADGNPASCTEACVLAVPYCGDGIQNAGRTDDVAEEQCDDGNQSNEDDCLNNCSKAICGDGYINHMPGEDGLAESCDELDSVNANNPNDLCHECRDTSWNSMPLLETSFERETLSFRAIADMTFDLSGNLYVLDVEMRQVFRINAFNGSLTDPSGRIDLVAGAGGAGGAFGGGGEESPLAIHSRLYEPTRIAVDGVGNLYILDHIWDRAQWSIASRIVKVDTRGLAEVIYDTGSGYDLYSTLVLDLAVDGIGTLFLGRGDPINDEVGLVTVLEPNGAGYTEHNWTVQRPDGFMYLDVSSLAFDPVSMSLLFTFWEGASVYRLSLNTGTPWQSPLTHFEEIATGDLCAPYRVDVSSEGHIIVSDAPGNGPSAYCSALGNRAVTLEGDWSTGWEATGSQAFGWAPFATDFDFSSDYFARLTPFALSSADGDFFSIDDSLELVSVGTGTTEELVAGTVSVDCNLPSARARPFGKISQVALDSSAGIFITDATDGRLFIVQQESGGIFGLEASEGGCTRVAQDAGDLGLLDVVVEDDGDVLVIDGCMRQIRRLSAVDGGMLSEVDGCAPEVHQALLAGTEEACGEQDCADGRLALDATFKRPSHLALSRGTSRNLYIVDGPSIYQISRAPGAEFSGAETVVRVATLPPLEDNSVAEAGALTFDSENNLLIADTSRKQIWRIDVGEDGLPAGDAYPIAGNPESCTATPEESCGDGGLAVDASFESLSGLWVDESDAIYVTDGHRVRRLLSVSGELMIATVAGKITREPPGGIGEGDVASAVRFGPLGGGAAGAGIVDEYAYYVIDQSGTLVRGVRQSDTEVWTVAGPIDWWGDCSDEEAGCVGRLSGPKSLAGYEDVTGNWVWAVTDQIAKRLRGVTLGELGVAQVDTLAGFGAGSDDESLCSDNCVLPVNVAPIPARYSRLLEQPFGVAYDALTGSLYMSEQDRAGRVGGPYLHCMDTRSSTLAMRVFAGSGQGSGYGTGSVTREQARFDEPAGLTVHSGYLYVADSGNQVVRRIRLDPNLACAGFGDSAGNYVAEFELWAGRPRQNGLLEDDGVLAVDSYLNQPLFVAMSPTGMLYISDTGNHRVRLVDSTGRIQTVLGSGVASSGSDTALALSYQVDTPKGLALDQYGNLFVASRTEVLVVVAGADGIAQGDDAVYRIYGAEQTAGVGTSASCLAGLSLESLEDTTRVHVLDECRGSWMVIERDP